MKLAKGQIVGGDYVITDWIDGGGSGDVYLAMQHPLKTERALKVLRSGLVDDRSLSRFAEEIRLTPRIQSDYVVQVISAGIDTRLELPWMALEWLSGHNLESEMRLRTRLTSTDIRWIMKQLGHALGAAHSSNILHLDLKPENIFLHQPRLIDAQRVVKLLDLGISRAIQPGASHVLLSSVCGTPLWMAPEQVVGTVASPQTDVWALGMIVFYLYTGHTYWSPSPHEGMRGIMEVLNHVQRDPMAPASQRAHEYGAAGLLPDGFDDWFATCTDRDRRSRFSNGGDACRRLLELLDAEAQRHQLASPSENPVEVLAQRAYAAFVTAEAASDDESMLAIGESVLAIRPGDHEIRFKIASAYLGRARSLLDLGDVDAALRAAERAAQLAPREAGPPYLRGLILARAGDWERARSALDAAIVLNAGVPAILVERARVRRRQGDLDGALSDCSRALDLAGPRVDLLVLRAGLAFARGDVASALSDCDLAVKLAPGRHDLLARRACLLDLQGESLRALADLTLAIERAPSTPEYHFQRAHVRWKTGDVRGGWEDLECSARLGMDAARRELAIWAEAEPTRTMDFAERKVGS